MHFFFFLIFNFIYLLKISDLKRSHHHSVCHPKIQNAEQVVPVVVDHRPIQKNGHRRRSKAFKRNASIAPKRNLNLNQKMTSETKGDVLTISGKSKSVALVPNHIQDVAIQDQHHEKGNKAFKLKFCNVIQRKIRPFRNRSRTPRKRSRSPKTRKRSRSPRGYKKR